MSVHRIPHVHIGEKLPTPSIASKQMRRRPGVRVSNSLLIEAILMHLNMLSRLESRLFLRRVIIQPECLNLVSE